MTGKLYLVPTPIGNLDDMTFRAVKVLKEVDFILAEDTRTSLKLLKHFEIRTKAQSHHKYNEHKTVDRVINKIKNGKVCALISDAGTPGIADPGFLITRKCIENKIEVDCLPGATAFVPAIINSGLPCDKFVFEGFLPIKKGRQKRLLFLSEEKRTMIFYETPHKLIKTLSNFVEYFGENRKTSVAREITKLYEETIRGSASEVLEHYKSKPPKGEIVIVVEGNK